MTPAARVSAAIECLDEIIAGAPAERVLTRWARKSRFAGSKDRAAIRDHVFDALRNFRSDAWLGGQPWPETTGRAVMLGGLRRQGIAPEPLFSGGKFGPEPLTESELQPAPPLPEAESWNLPDNVAELLRASLGVEAGAAALMLASRAPVCLRVNLSRTTRDAAQARLASEGIATEPNPLSAAALTVTDGARQVQRSACFTEGLVELQDASSQAVVEGLLQVSDGKVLDFCAGGGGKSLALAMRGHGPVWAHDADPGRMADIPTRATRAGVDLRVCAERAALPGGFALVLADAPCSGSGAWRRAPDAKWRFTPERLTALNEMQDTVLDAAAEQVGPGGCLAYATCSVFEAENDARVAAFLARHQGWRETTRQFWAVSEHGDGFYCAQLWRE